MLNPNSHALSLGYTPIVKSCPTHILTLAFQSMSRPAAPLKQDTKHTSLSSARLSCPLSLPQKIVQSIERHCCWSVASFICACDSCTCKLNTVAVTRNANRMFVLLCAGHDSQVASAVMADKIEWCGGEYDVADLKAALAVLLPTGTPQDQLLAQEYSDPWAPDTWNLLGPPAQSLLRDLAAAQATFNAHVSLKTLSGRTHTYASHVIHNCALLPKQSACSGSLFVQGLWA